MFRLRPKKILMIGGVLLTLVSGAFHQVQADSVIEALTRSAEQGDREAQSLLGQIYLRGDGVALDERQAIFWFEKAAVNGDMLAQYYYAWAYHAGVGVKKDLSLALHWYEQSAGAGYGPAVAQVESLKRDLKQPSGDGLLPADQIALPAPEPFAEMRKSFNQLKGYNPAIYRAYIKFMEDNRLTADPAGQNFMGYLFLKLATSKDVDNIDSLYGKACGWFLQAAQGGHAGAQYNLGNCFLFGYGADFNLEAAERWMKSSRLSIEAFIPSNYTELSEEFRMASEYSDGYDAAIQGYESANRELIELIQLALINIKARQRLNN